MALKEWVNGEPTRMLVRVAGFMTGIWRVAKTVMTKVLAAMRPFESVSWAMKVATLGVVGVPVMVPSELRERPVGRAPLKRDL